MTYTKLHGLGNDFIVFFDKDGRHKDYSELAKKLCHRQTGIGGDGLIVAVPSEVADICMRIINGDGSEAEMCGNGVRVFAKFVYETGLVKKTEMTVETLAGIMKPTLTIEADKVTLVCVDMGKPTFAPQAIPMKVDGMTGFHQSIEIDGESYRVHAVLMGVPHTQVFVDSVEAVPLTLLGPKLEKHPMFPKGTNVNFVEVVNRKHVKVRTWERGAGATLACGTGSCASALTAYELGYTERQVEVELYLGSLYIDYNEDGTVYMTGPAETSFKAEINE